MQKPKQKRSLRMTVLLAVGACLLIFIVAFFGIFRIAMSQTLMQVEDTQVKEQVAVVDGMLQTTAGFTLAMAQDLALWEESVLFVQDENPNYIENNWPGSTPLQYYQFNFIVLKDTAGADKYVEFRDYVDGGAMAAPAGFTQALTPYAGQALASYAFTDGEPPEGKSGILFIDGVPYHLCIMPIVLPERGAEPVGTMILGQILDNRFFQNLTQYTSLQFSLLQEFDPKLAEGLVIDRSDRESLTITKPMQDMDGNTILLRIDGGRSQYTEGVALINGTTLVLVLAVVVLMFALYFILARMLLRPLEDLSADIGNLKKSSDVRPGRYGGSREFHTLGVAIGDMLKNQERQSISLGVMESVLNNLDTCLMVSDPETDEVIFMNDRMRQDYGVEGEAEGRRCWELLQTDYTDRCPFCPLHQLAQNPDDIVIWEEKSPRNGKYYKNADCLIEWQNGRPMHLQHNMDITDLKQAEFALKKRLEQQELMSAIAQNFISMGDTTQLVQNALRMTGEFLNVGKILLSHVDLQSQLLTFTYEWYNQKQDVAEREQKTYSFGPGEPIYDALVAEGQPCLVYGDVSEVPAYQYLAAYGVKGFMSIPIMASGKLWGVMSIDECEYVHPWSESDIQLALMVGSVISAALERSETDEKLLRMSSIVDASPLFISYMSNEGQFSYVNDSVCSITGYTETELLEHHISVLCDEATERRMTEEVLPGVLREGSIRLELPLQRKDGQMRSMEVSMFTTGATEKGIAIIASDITEKLQMENDLIEAKELAEQSNRAKSEFLARMSHEMRTPMNAIIGMTNIAKASADPQKKEYCLDKIDDASTHLLGVINDILDMSKIEAGKFELSYSEFNLEKMLIRVTNVMNFRIEEKHQEFMVQLSPRLSWTVVNSDEQRLAQVVTNLLANAVKFTPEGGRVELNVDCEDEQESMCTLRVLVKDTGIGISEEQQSRLFRSFEQADGGIARRFGGTGLGLAISKNIVELLGGKIWVDSKEGEGATFGFTVPVKIVEAPHPMPALAGVQWKDLQVLVVDDAADVREYFMALAKRMGFVCDVADGAEAAISLLRSNENGYHVVFVDWSMPDMDGIELTRLIRSQYGTNSVVIMISSTDWANIQEEAKQAGVDIFLPKPLFASLIVDCLNRCLGTEATAPSKEEEAKTYDGAFEGKRVLLAEDIEINREIVMSLLEHTGLQFVCAENGRKAVEAFEENPGDYDAILMDIHMPEMDGLQATREIRALDIPQAKIVPIIAMTANVFREDVEKCLAAGMNSHVGKPVDFDELIRTLDKYLPKGKK